MATRPVNLDNIKGRIAEALVESIFRRAEFKMTRFGRESDLRGMIVKGRRAEEPCPGLMIGEPRLYVKSFDICVSPLRTV
jgi:hypothetical protein